MTQLPSAPADAAVIALLRERDGLPTAITLREGESITVYNIAWGYDIGDTHAHVTSNISPAIIGTTVHVFFTDDVTHVVDAETGEDLSGVLTERHWGTHCDRAVIRSGSMGATTERLEWPHVYRVALQGLNGEARVQTVLTFFGELKAVAMVVQGHPTGWLGPKRAWPVYAVEVDDLGPAPKNKDGTVGCPEGCWDDRSEF